MATERLASRLEVLLGSLLFAVSVPAGKLLLRELHPLALSGGLYLSAGLVCTTLLLLDAKRAGTRTNWLAAKDWPWLGAAVLLGGAVAPLALFLGLRSTSAYAAGLLLNLESTFTVLLGIVLYRESAGRGGFLGMALILAGAVALSLLGRAPGGEGGAAGAILIVVACACWAVDNALMRRVSIRDARQITAVKGLVGGGASLGLAAALGQLGSWSPTSLAAVAVIGAISYGLSIMLFIRGLRALGVALTGAYFALAPAMAAVLSWILLREPIQNGGWLALAGMTAGAVLLARDSHRHFHVHEGIEHENEHEHDGHHRHAHAPGELERVPHAHRHVHEPLVHVHAHAHDVHHRHAH